MKALASEYQQYKVTTDQATATQELSIKQQTASLTALALEYQEYKSGMETYVAESEEYKTTSESRMALLLTKMAKDEDTLNKVTMRRLSFLPPIYTH